MHIPILKHMWNINVYYMHKYDKFEDMVRYQIM